MKKNWKNLLTEMGYEKVSIKSIKKSDNKREKIGLNLTTKKKTKIFISFAEMSLDYPRMTSILIHNLKKAKKPKKLKSHIEDYVVPKVKHTTFFTKFEYRMKILLEIYSNDTTKKIDTDNLKKLAEKYDVLSSNLYEITTFQSKEVTIVDNKNTITLKKSAPNTKKNAISDMLDLAVVKGWNLNTLIISGSDDFIGEVKKQISNRTSSSMNISGRLKM